MVTWCARGASPFCYNVGARLATSVGALLFLFPKSYYRVHAPPAVFASLACKVHPARFWKFSFVFNFFLSFKIWKTGERFCSDLFFPHVLKFHFFLFPIELHAPFFVVVVFPPLQFHLVDVELFLLFFFQREISYAGSYATLTTWCWFISFSHSCGRLKLLLLRFAAVTTRTKCNQTRIFFFFFPGRCCYTFLFHSSSAFFPSPRWLTLLLRMISYITWAPECCTSKKNETWERIQNKGKSFKKKNVSSFLFWMGAEELNAKSR